MPFTDTYDIHVYMLLAKLALVDMQDDKDEQVILPYVSNFYATFAHIPGVIVNTWYS